MIDANTEMLQLSDEDFKEIMIKMPQWAITNKLEISEKEKVTAKKYKSQQSTEDTKNHQVEILELKNTVTEIKI